MPLSNTPDPRPHAVVIGAGFGGLAAAVRLGARGYRVTVLDKLDKPGGRAYVYEDQGFKYDGGPTVVTAPFLFEELWELVGKRMEDDVTLVPVDPFYRVRFDDGDVFDYRGDAQKMRDEVAKFAPGDVDGYERFVEMSRKIFLTGFEELSFEPFSTFGSMMKIVPDMVRLRSDRTVYQLVSKYVKNEKVRQVLSFHPLLVGGNPFSVTSIYTLIAYLERKWGVHYAMGGTGSLVRGLVGLIEGQGGTVRLNTAVEQVVLDGKRATGVRARGPSASGDAGAGPEEVIDADIVVSNADSAYLYKKLVPAHARRTWTDKRLDRSRYSMGLFVWYFGTDRKYDDVAHHTILLGPRYRGLLDDIFKHKVLAEDFSLYLHRPTATDPAMAPNDGCDTFYVLSPVPHLDSGTDWETENERYRLKIQRYLQDAILPDLDKHIVSSLTLHPQGFHDRLLSVKGAAFGLEPTLTQSAWFRPHNLSEDIAGLFLVGAGTHPGAGMPGVLSSAKVIEKLVPDAEAVLAGATAR
jgi:phytoene desaturase